MLEARNLLSTTPFPTPLEPILPAGSLIHFGQAAGAFEVLSDSDSLTIAIDAGQTISAVLVPQHPSIQARAELFNPDGFSLGAVEATGPGAAIVLQALSAPATGTYRIDTSNLAGTGNYTVRLILGAVVEEESWLTSTNDTLASAQSLETSNIALATGASRIGAVGVADDGASDFYSMQLDGGQPATFVLGIPDGAGGDLELFDAAGNRLAKSNRSEDGNQRIDRFVPSSTGTYFARVSGTPDAEYSLLATRNADFNREPNSSAVEAQSIAPASQVLAALGTTGGRAGGRQHSRGGAQRRKCWSCHRPIER